MFSHICKYVAARFELTDPNEGTETKDDLRGHAKVGMF